LAVDNTEGPPIPAVFHRCEQGSKIPSTVRRQQTGDVFEEEKFWPKRVNNSKGDEGQISAGIGKPKSLSGNTPTLTRTSEDDEVNRLRFFDFIPFHLCNVTKIFHTRMPRR